MENTYELLENGIVIETFNSRRKAKDAYHWKVKEANDDMLDLWYEIRKKD